MGNSKYDWALGEKLLREGKTDKEVADVLGCKTHTVITHRMKVMGIKRRLRRHRKEDYAHLLNSGMNCNQIAKAIGCAPSIVYGWRSAAKRKAAYHEAPREKATKAGILFRIHKYIREEFETEAEFKNFVASKIGRITVNRILLEYNRLEIQKFSGPYYDEGDNDDGSKEEERPGLLRGREICNNGDPRTECWNAGFVGDVRRGDSEGERGGAVGSIDSFNGKPSSAGIGNGRAQAGRFVAFPACS